MRESGEDGARLHLPWEDGSVAETARALPRRVLDEVALFAYVTAPNTPTYRAIMEVFFAAKQHFAVDLRPAEILNALRRSPFVVELKDEKDLELSLAKLVEWGNLLRSHDSSAVGRIDDFYRKRYVYHLSSAGQAAHRAVREVEATVGKSGALQAGMLAKIHESLLVLAEASTGAETSPETLHARFQDLFSSFEFLTEEANRFIGELHRRLDQNAGEPDRFAMMKEAVFAYIQRFLEHLRALEGRIVDRIREIEETGIGALLEVAARSADLPPGFGEGDPRQEWMGEQRERWGGVVRWFLGGKGSSPIVAELSRAAVHAVVGLARALGRLNDRQSGRAGRKADFLALARRFAACPDDASAHELWRDAIGLYPARHFHLEEVDPDLADSATSWWDSPRVVIPVRMRTRGRASRAGRSSAVPDRSGDKRWMAERRKREREQLDAARGRFSGRGELRMSDIARLDALEFDLLLELLDEALTSPRRSDGSRSVRTRDGCLDVVLSEPADGEGELAEIETPRGRLRCRDFAITVTEVSSEAPLRAGGVA